MRPESRSSRRLLRAREREVLALAARARGATFAQIGLELGCTPQAAHKAVDRALAATEKAVLGAAGRLRALEIVRLDAVLAAIWPAAMGGDLGAVDRVVKISARRARLLGLDAAQPRPEEAQPAIRDLSALIRAVLSGEGSSEG